MRQRPAKALLEVPDPGQPASRSTRLSLICADGTRGAGKYPTCDAQVAWLARCNNPEQNDPDECYGLLVPEACASEADCRDGLESFSLFSFDGVRLDAPHKSLWLSYFTNAGNLPDDDGSFTVRPPAGAEEVRRTECIRWQAPRTTTQHAHLWAVVRDNRGRLTAWDQRIIVR